MELGERRWDRRRGRRGLPVIYGWGGNRATWEIRPIMLAGVLLP